MVDVVKWNCRFLHKNKLTKSDYFVNLCCTIKYKRCYTLFIIITYFCKCIELQSEQLKQKKCVNWLPLGTITTTFLQWIEECCFLSGFDTQFWFGKCIRLLPLIIVKTIKWSKAPWLWIQHLNFPLNWWFCQIYLPNTWVHHRPLTLQYNFY